MASNSKQEVRFMDTELCTSCRLSPGPGSNLLQVLEGCNELWSYWLDLSRMVPDPLRRWSRHIKEYNHECRTPDCYFHKKKYKYTFKPFLLNLVFALLYAKVSMQCVVEKRADSGGRIKRTICSGLRSQMEAGGVDWLIFWISWQRLA